MSVAALAVATAPGSAGLVACSVGGRHRSGPVPQARRAPAAEPALPQQPAMVTIMMMMMTNLSQGASLRPLLIGPPPHRGCYGLVRTIHGTNTELPKLPY